MTRRPLLREPARGKFLQWPVLDAMPGCRALLLALGCSLTGCAAFQPAEPDAARDPRLPNAASTDNKPASGAPAWQVEVDAPAALKLLLERHLDLIRLSSLTGGAEVSDEEIGRLIDATPNQAQELLQTEGYFSPQVSVEQIGDASPAAGRRVRVRVQPGPLTRVQRFDLEVVGDLARAVERGDTPARELLAALRSSWPLPRGAPFRNAQWSDAKAGVLSRLRTAGYVLANWSGSTAQVDAPREQVRLYLVADTGPLFRTGELIIEGLQLQDRRAVDYLAGFGPGNVITDSLLLDFQDRLLKSGLFEQASVALDTESPDPAAARVRVRVKEQARHQLVTAVGVSSNAGPRVSLEHIDRRVFGWAATARNKAEWGLTRQAWDGELSTHVREDSYRWFAGGTIERLKTDTDIVLSHRIRSGRALESARIERIQYLEWDSATRRTSLARSRSEALTVNQGWIWRDIDNPLLPTDGQTLSVNLSLGQARDSVTGSSPLARAQGRLTAYRPLGGGWYAQGRIEAGQVFVREAATLTDNLGFRAGGDDSVRGYGHRSIGPLRDGAVASGKLLLTGSAEVARPLTPTMPTLWGAVFVDVGGAADRWGELDPVLGTGVGLRWRSPVGPLKLDLAYGQALRRVRLHFSVGIVF